MGYFHCSWIGLHPIDYPVGTRRPPDVPGTSKSRPFVPGPSWTSRRRPVDVSFGTYFEDVQGTSQGRLNI